MLETIVVPEPDLLSFDLWLASNPDEEAVARWLRAIEAYYARMDRAALEEQS